MGLKIFAFIVLLTMVVTVLGSGVWLLGLPGRKAKERGHPQAEAITAAGWLSLLLPPLWPLALVWALVRTSENPAPAQPELEPTPALANEEAPA